MSQPNTNTTTQDPATNHETLDLPGGMFRSGDARKETFITMERRVVGEVNVAVQFTEVDGLALYEGDIVFGTMEEMQAKENAAAAAGRGIIVTGAQFRWPGGEVFYIVEDALRERVDAAIAHWQEHTPFRFKLRTTEPDFISFERRNGCFSRVGRQGGMQVISLGLGCGLGAAIHEIGHAIGLWHEQSRADRDDHIEIIRENIIPQQLHNFDKHVLDGDDLGTYDFGSIMHYPATAFSINGQPTIRTRNGASIGQRNGLSAGDIAALRLAYPALAWPPLPPQPTTTPPQPTQGTP